MESGDPVIRGVRAEPVERLHEQLRESLQVLVTSEDWRQALAVAARFHDYSFANTRLIWSEAAARGFAPDRVAGYRTWQKLGRQVRRGEKGLSILAPVTRKIEAADGEEERRVVGFRVVHVFDISQTDGEPLAEVRAAVLDGDLPVHWGRVAELITSAGFSLEVADVDRLGEANGITDWRDRQVVVRQSLPGAQRFKTAVHELAHISLHEPASGDRPNCRGVVEVEAESVAYVVCAALGIDSTGYSLPYVASWSGGDLDKVAATANRVTRCARGVLTSLEAEQDLVRDRIAPEITLSHDRQPGSTGRRLPDPAATAPTGDRHAELDEALGSAVAFYQAQLRDPDGAQARAFLQQRGFDDDTLSRWQLGYAPANSDTLVRTLRSRGVSDGVLLDAGLAGRARTGRLYDRMRGRVVFPVCDNHGAPRGFAGRLIAGDGPKYLNSPETPLYTKRSLLYGLHLATPAITETGTAVVVEGYTDAIAAHQAGITNTVAAAGTSLTPQHIEALRGVASTITLAFDADPAGLQAAQHVAELPKTALVGFTVQIAALPDGSDPASLIAGGHPDLLQSAVANPTPLVAYLIDHVVSQHNLEEPEALVRALRAAGPLVAHLTDSSSDRAQAVTHLARRVGRSEHIVEAALKSHPHIHRGETERSAGRTLT
ncbi:MAG: toprim domain-containing protein [Acidobacteria bacterium]|nr:toprim domain-containing protein [Acidobacteriota bacterium]